MKHLLTITLLSLSLGAMGQGRPKKSEFIDTLLTNITGQSTTYISTYTQKQDTVTSYFNEITGVENGKLITQWVKGYRIKSTYYQNTWAINTFVDDVYLYPDKKTKVTNKIIQSY